MTDEKKPTAGPPERDPGKTWDPDGEIERWKTEYESMLKGSESAATEGLEGQERRGEPRFSFSTDQGVNIFAHIGPKAFRILNVSVGGVAFYSETHFEPGTPLLLSALGMVALDVEVVSCEMEETDASFMEFQYLVRARFSPRVNGYLVYVLSREMYLKQTQDAQGAG